jgi:hypothetical protein
MGSKSGQQNIDWCDIIKDAMKNNRVTKLLDHQRAP